MKKSVLLFLLAFAILIILGLVFKYFVSDFVFDTRAVTQTTALNITVDMYPPDLIIDSPKNIAYSTNSIDIKYSVSDSGSGVDSVWYNLDGGQNMTLTGNTAIIVSEGNHMLYVYAKDVAGLVNGSEFVAFFVE